MRKAEENIVRELLFRAIKSIPRTSIEGIDYIPYSSVINTITWLVPNLISTLHNRDLL